ncbi:hypothetical protein [Methylomonas sp. CM2]|uniref:hypothetical protein n=1 Tax=Methylomonas sp. CM2 TaxID=3417647 RepID=UPI003CF2DBE0
MSNRSRGRPSKARFYHVRWNKVGLNQERAAEVLGVDVDTIERWDQEGNELAERHLLLWDQKHVGVEGWEGFIFTRGKLKYKSHRWTPRSLLLWRDQAEQIERLETEIKRLKTLSGMAETLTAKFKHRRR